MRYLGKKYGLFGKNLKEEAEIDMLIQTAEDIMLAFAQKAYDPNFVSYKPQESPLLQMQRRESHKSYKGAFIKVYLSCD